MVEQMEKASLSYPRRRLVETMQTLGFGRIEGLIIRNGEPIFDPPPRVVRVVKFGGENGPRPELEYRNFKLKGHVMKLFLQISRLEDGTEVSIEVKHGLPFKMEAEDLIRT